MKKAPLIKVSAPTMKAIKAKLKHGDIEAIAAQSGLHRNTISYGIKYGSMAEVTFKAITNYLDHPVELA